MAQNQKLPNYGCHFTWKWLNNHLKDKSQQYILDRIESLDREIESQEDQEVKRDLPRLYVLKGFLRHRYAKVEGYNELLEDARKLFEKALKECNTDNIGYKYVILNNLKHILQLTDGDEIESEQKKFYENQLEEINENKEKIMVEREVNAIQGYAAGHFHLRKLCIEHYKKAGKSRAEWCFGLALVKEKNNCFSDKEKGSEVSDLLDEAINLDSSYFEAKLKKAKILFRQNEDKEAENVLQEILREHSDSLKIKEEVASAYSKRNPTMAIQLFKECYEKDNSRQKTLRGLGLLYLFLWKKDKKKIENIEKSIKYRTELVELKDNRKIFDNVDLADTYLKKYKKMKMNDKNRQRIRKEIKKIGKEINEKFNEIIEKMNNNENPNSDIQACYKISLFFKEFPKGDKEVEWLKNVLENEFHAIEEENYKPKTIIKDAKERLETLLKEGHSKSFEIKIWLLKSEKKFQVAIKSIEEKQKEPNLIDEFKQMLFEEKAACYIGWINEKDTTDKISLLQDLEESINKINVGRERRLNLIFKSIPDDDDLKVLKAKFMKFTKSMEDFDLYKSLLEQAKTVLDITIHHLFMVARLDGEPKQNTMYPPIGEFKKQTEEARLECLVKKLKGIFWRGMKKNELEEIDLLKIIPQLKEFNKYFDSIKYQWYDDFQRIRNVSTHKPGYLVTDVINDVKEPKEIAINATFYSACVFQFVKSISTRNGAAETSTTSNNVSESPTTNNNVAEPSTTKNNVSETSTNNNNVFESSTTNNNVSETSITNNNVAETFTTNNNVSESSTTYNNVSESSTTNNNVSESPTTNNNVAEPSTTNNNVSETSTTNNNVSKSSTTYNNVSESSTTNNNVSESPTINNNVADPSATNNNVSESSTNNNNLAESSTNNNNVSESFTTNNSVAETSTTVSKKKLAESATKKYRKDVEGTKTGI